MWFSFFLAIKVCKSNLIILFRFVCIILTYILFRGDGHRRHHDGHGDRGVHGDQKTRDDGDQPQ